MPAAWIAFAIASTFFLFEFVTRMEPSLAAGPIAHFYGLSQGDFGTLASVFFWIYAPMQIVVGLALDRYGARRFILLGSACCAVGVLMFAATANIWVGGSGRVLTGFGASFAFVAALWLVNHWFAPERFAFLSGAVNAVGMVGTAIGGIALVRSDYATRLARHFRGDRHRRPRFMSDRAGFPARAAFARHLRNHLAARAYPADLGGRAEKSA